MRTTVQKLRTLIVVLFLLLVVGILSFLGYARWRLRRLAHDLPGKLGIEIQQSTNDFTFSKTQAGKTLFTIHASKAVQLKAGGKALLHDVSITLYNRTDGSADHISGSEFEYDQKTGEARATGSVHIDLHAPAPATPAAASVPATTHDHSENDRNLIHILTSNLVFNQKTGIATTPSYIEFHFPQASGSAVGATYNSQDGTLLLDHQVAIDSLTSGQSSNRPVALRAASASLDRKSSQAVLQHVTYTSGDQHGSADSATAFMHPDGTADHVAASGNVLLTTGDGSRVSAPHATAQFGQRSIVHQINLTGGVAFLSSQPTRQVDGHSSTAQIDFDPAGQARHAVLDQSVSIADVDSTPGNTATRHLNSAHLDIDLVPTAAARPGTHPSATKVEPRTLIATGDAVADLQSQPAGKPAQHSTIAADRIESTLAPGNHLTRVHGSGHTRLTDHPASGATQVSTGDDLILTFASASASPTHTETSTLQTAALQMAVQQGHVILTQTAPPTSANHPSTTETPARSGLSTATADRAEYNSGTETVLLTGNPHLKDDSLALNAQQIELKRTSGDATARGAVQATYLQAPAPNRPTSGPILGGAQPVHAIGDQADFHRVTQVATFRGHARLWQGPSTIEAPVIELNRTRQTVSAHAAESSPSNPSIQPVQAAFLDSASGTPNAKKGPSVINISSQTLLYSDAERLATFTGSVHTRSADGQLFADNAQVYLLAAGQQPVRAPAVAKSFTGSASSAPRPESAPPASVDHITATGHIHIQQPGRTATADRLVYTAADGKFVLTGSLAAPPRVVDAQKGTVTGESLIFFSRDDTVRVAGNGGSTTTETRVRH